MQSCPDSRPPAPRRPVMTATVVRRTGATEIELALQNAPLIETDGPFREVFRPTGVTIRYDGTTPEAITIHTPTDTLSVRMDLRADWEAWLPGLVDEHQPDPRDAERARQWAAVEAIVTRARDKGVQAIDTDLLAEALGLDEQPPPAVTCRAPGSPSCACVTGEYRFCGATLDRDEYPHTCLRRVAHRGDCAPTLDPETPCITAGPDEGGDGSHPFDAEHQTESDAKRRLPRCKECGGQADNQLHDGDQRETTRHYRMLLAATAASKTPATDS